MVAKYRRPSPPEQDREDVLFVSRRRGRDWYWFVFTPATAYQAICQANRWVANGRLNFTADDGERIAAAIREQVSGGRE